MSRVLQMRRGTAAENDNFTGLLGEVTVDTDTMTLRVHDGRTLGGVALARADAVPTGGNIDLTTVPDEKWDEIVAAHSPAPYIVRLSNYCDIPTDSGLEYIFSTDTFPFAVHTYLVCHSPEAGYAVGDEVSSFGFGNLPCPMPNVFTKDGVLHIALLTAGAAFWVLNNETGQVTPITNENWRVQFRIYC